MKRIFRILVTIALILVGILVIGISLTTAYIVLAPDDLPKPFYLVYHIPTPTPIPTESAGENDPSESGHPGKDSAGKAVPAEIKPGHGIMIDTGPKIVNLVDPTGRKYLRVGIVLEFLPPDPDFFNMKAEQQHAYVEKFEEEAQAKMPVVNDIIITLLASQTFESIYTAQGKEILRKQIMSTINTQLPDYQVIFVYFTEFVVQ